MGVGISDLGVRIWVSYLKMVGGWRGWLFGSGVVVMVVRISNLGVGDV